MEVLKIAQQCRWRKSTLIGRLLRRYTWTTDKLEAIEKGYDYLDFFGWW
jgi:hypothetical protein